MLHNFRSGYDKNLYFPLLNDESKRSNQNLQLANIYDLQGNNLLLDELVLMDRNYEFRKFSDTVHALIGKNPHCTHFSFLGCDSRKLPENWARGPC